MLRSANRHFRWPTLLLLVGSAIGTATHRAEEPPVLTLDDRPEPLDPLSRRSEQELDRLHATALFTSARALEQAGNESAALRLYQRAYRYDPAASILREVVPLAFSLGRTDEALRYALLSVERDPSDEVLLRRLAMYMTEKQEYEKAIELYETLLAQQKENSSETVQIQFQLGRLYFLTENFKHAAKSLAVVYQALQEPEKFELDDDDRNKLLGTPELTYAMMGECFLRAERYDLAKKAFDQVQQAKPDRGQHGFYMARVLAGKKKYDEAIDQLQAYFDARLSGSGSEPYELLVELHDKLDQSAEATAALEAIWKQDDKNPALSLFLADRYRKAGEYAKAEPLYEQALEEEDTRYKLLAITGLIDVYHKAKQPEKFLEALATLVEIAGSIDALADEVEEVATHKKFVRNILRAAEKFRSGDDVDLPDGIAQAAAELAMLAESFDKAETFYQWAIDREPEREVALLQTWGIGLALADKYEASADKLRKAIRATSDRGQQATLNYQLAGILEYAGDTEAALAAADKAISLQPDSADLASRRPWILYHAGRNDDAREAYSRFIAKHDEVYDSTSVREQLAEARLMLSHLASTSGDMDTAEELLEQVLDENPGDLGAMNDLAYIWADQKKHLSRSLSMAQKAVEAEPKNAAYLDTLAWAHFQLGNIAKAHDVLTKAIELQGDAPDGVIFDHLGDVRAAEGKLAAAWQAWRQAMELFADDDDQEMLTKTREKLTNSGAPPEP